MISICYDDNRCKFADVAELVDALDLGSSVFGREGSSPFIRMPIGFIRVSAFTVTPVNAKAKSYSILTMVDFLKVCHASRSHFLFMHTN